MSIRIKPPLILQEFSHGVETFEVTGHIIRECLEKLEAQFPTIKDYLLDRQGRLLHIFGIDPMDLDIPLHDKDESIILNLITGG